MSENEDFENGWMRVEEDAGRLPPGRQSMANAIEERLIALAVRSIKVAGALPNTPAGNHAAGQVLRAGTSPAPNYAEARGAESLADFVHKLGIVRKELNETDIWFRIITKAELLPETKLTAVRDECVELTKIIASSVATLRQKRNAK